MKIKLSEIIDNIKKYRGKPIGLPLTKSELFICLMVYSNQDIMYPNYKAWSDILESSHT